MSAPTIQEWMEQHPVGLEMLWKGAAGAQLAFARDNLQGLIGAGIEDFEARRSFGKVISTHRSKSIDLPVYAFDRPDLGARFILRENFYNWKLSVISETPIVANFDGLFHTTPPVEPDYTGNALASCYFEGFPNDLIFGYYEPSDKRRWSAEIGGDFALWTTVFLCMRALGVIKPYKWHTRESHRAELGAERARWDAKRAAK